jgi:ribosomal protein S18 acetylase RimI-like enzyme
MAEIRLAEAADAAELVQLIQSAYRGEESRQGWTSEADLLEGDRIDLEEVLSLINGHNSVILVLDDGTRIAGCCKIERRANGGAYFGTFAVSPAAQGGGLGRRLMAEAERRAVDIYGAERLEMTVLAQQAALIAWYERLGFRRTGETIAFPADPKHARPLRDDLHFLVLAKQLS